MSTRSGSGHPDHRQEDPLGGLAEEEVLHRRRPDDRRGVDRRRGASTCRSSGRSGSRRPACRSRCGRRRAPRAAGRSRRRSPRARSRTRPAPRGRPSGTRTISTLLAAQEAGEDHLVDARRQRRAWRSRWSPGAMPIATATGTRPCESRRWAAPSLWICQCIIAVRRSTFWMRYMPQLRAPVTRVAAEDQRQRDERAAVVGPAGEDRQQVEVGLVEPDLLAGALLDHLGRERGQLAQLAERLHLVHHALGRLQVDQRLDPLAERVEARRCRAPGTSAARCRTG